MARTTSTQDVVRRAARQGAPAGYCCVATEQTAGRGRQGRRWHAPPGAALLASVLLRTSHPVTAALPFAAGLAVIDALDLPPDVAARLKWPNDVLVEGRKLAGILVEHEPRRHDPAAPPRHEAASTWRPSGAAIVGLGLNLTVDAFPSDVAGISLHRLVASPPSAETILLDWLSALWRRAARVTEEGMRPLLEEWRRHAIGLGEPVRVSTGSGVLEGVALDVAEDGALLVRSDGAVHRVLAGDVHLLREVS